MQTATATRISLGVGCSEECDAFSLPLLGQLVNGGYDECSVLPLQNPSVWRQEHRTARKRSDRAHRIGYRFELVQRHRYADDIHAINTSAESRQGRPMSAGYKIRPGDTPDPPYCCRRHGVHPYGVQLDGKLVAYTWVYRCGELALVSQILGHADHLENGIMFLLFEGAVLYEDTLGGVFVYNRHDSGTDGLRWFKERLGFRPELVEWLP